MKYRKLGKTGIQVSVVGLGAWQFGGEWGKDFGQLEVSNMLARASELGINLIDTAECYGDHLSENLIGQAIKSQRDKWIVATKFGHRFLRPFERAIEFEPARVQKQLEESLMALQTDYVDLYQFHSGTDDMFDTNGLWEMLRKQVSAGKIRHLGISISKDISIYQVDKATEVGAEVIQVIYNRIDRRPEEHIFSSCIQQELGVLARVPLASGYLSGKYGKDVQFDKADIRAVYHDDETRRKIIGEVEKLKKEVPEGVPMAKWALAWSLQNPVVTCVIPGCKNVGQVESNAEASDLEMVRRYRPLALTS